MLAGVPKTDLAKAVECQLELPPTSIRIAA